MVQQELTTIDFSGNRGTFSVETADQEGKVTTLSVRTLSARTQVPVDGLR